MNKNKKNKKSKDKDLVIRYLLNMRYYNESREFQKLMESNTFEELTLNNISLIKTTQHGNTTRDASHGTH